MLRCKSLVIAHPVGRPLPVCAWKICLVDFPAIYRLSNSFYLSRHLVGGKGRERALRSRTKQSSLFLTCACERESSWLLRFLLLLLP